MFVQVLYEYHNSEIQFQSQLQQDLETLAYNLYAKSGLYFFLFV